MSYSNPMHHPPGARRPAPLLSTRDQLVDLLDKLNWAAFSALDALPEGQDRQRLAEAVRVSTQTLLRELQH